MYLRNDIWTNGKNTVVLLGPSTIAMLWPVARGLLDKAPRVGPQTCSDWGKIIAQVWKGFMQVWLIRENDGDYFAAMLTEVREYETDTVLEVLTMGGERLDEALVFWRMLERWAKSKGASWIRIEGRRGLERPMAKLGFEAPCVTLHKRI